MFQFLLFFIVVGLIRCDGDQSAVNETIGLRVGDSDKYHEVVARLQAVLLKDYNKDVRPAVSHGQPLNVRVRMTLTHFDLDERKSTFTAQCWLHREWVDARLEWKPSEYEGLQAIHLPSSSIWTPDFTLYNNAEASKINLQSEIPAVVHSNGAISWFPGSTYVALCNIDALYWPFDMQMCTLHMGSWAHDGNEISLSVAENGTRQSDITMLFAANNQWRIFDSVAAFHEQYYSCCPEPYHFVDFSFYLKRVNASFGAIFIIPGLVIILLTLSSFFLPPKCSKKIVIALVDFVVVVVYLLHLSSILPPMGRHVPFIVSFYSATLVLIGFSILFNITTRRWLHLPQRDSPPIWIQNILSGIIGRILLMGYSPPQINKNARDTGGVECLESGMENESDTKCIMEKDGPIYSIDVNWLTLVVALDRLVFITYCLTFIIFTFAFL